MNTDHQIGGGDPHQLKRGTITIKSESEKWNKKFQLYSKHIRLTITNLSATNVSDATHVIQNTFNHMVHTLFDYIPNSSYIRFVLQSPKLDKALNMPFVKRELFTTNLLMEKIRKILNSNEEFLLDGNLDCLLAHVEVPSGGKNSSRTYVDKEREIDDRHTFIKIRNNDNLCFARSLVMGLAHLDFKTGVISKKEYDQLRMDNYGKQTTAARKLHERTGLGDSFVGIDQITSFQHVLNNIQIKIVSKQHGDVVVYAGPQHKNKVYIYLHDGHYTTIKSMTGFHQRSFYCDVCDKPYTKKRGHRCEAVCSRCDSDQCFGGNEVVCQDCNMSFFGVECFQRHKEILNIHKGKSKCDVVKVCGDCGKWYNAGDRRRKSGIHVCGEVICSSCKEFVEPGHLCYMKPRKSDVIESDDDNDDDDDDEFEVDVVAGTGDEKGFKYLFFDIETVEDVGHVHVANMCVCMKVCNKCHKTGDRPCSVCGEQEKVFTGSDCEFEFCKWLYSGVNNGYTVIAHNLKGFDSYFLINYLIDNGIKPNLIYSGSKILYGYVKGLKIRIIDSLSFIPKPLADFPKTFGLENYEKGFFPHHFNKWSNQNYSGGIPDKEFFGPDDMMPARRSEFERWYDECVREGYSFVMSNELLRYCRSDVKILMDGCLKFRDEFVGLTTIDPFRDGVTIASVCNLVYRTLFLKEESIGIIPRNNYTRKNKQSSLALGYLQWLSAERGYEDLLHVENGGEAVICGCPVDGYSPSRNLVLQVHGCFWHGCSKCFPDGNQVNPVNGYKMRELRERTLKVRSRIVDAGYEYKEWWECDIREEIKVTPELKKTILSAYYIDPINPRDSLFGGRCNAAMLYKEVRDGEKMRYIDVNSLYPYVCKYKRYPVGHPQIIDEGFEDINQYFGIIKCRLIPPKNMLHPIIPYRAHGKLFFGLCRSCIDDINTGSCAHNDLERSFTGTYVTEEVKLAVTNGYIIDKVFQVWHYSEAAEYDPTTQSGGLFSEYINTFLRSKAEASGLPSNVKNETDPERREALLQDYIDDFYNREGKFYSFCYFCFFVMNL